MNLNSKVFSHNNELEQKSHRNNRSIMNNQEILKKL